MLVGGLMFAVGGCCDVGLLAPPPLGPHAASSSIDAITRPPIFMVFIPSFIDYLPPLVEHKCVVSRPGQANRLAFKLLGVAVSVHVLTYRHQLLPAIEAH